ncbi:MAG: branched-chain amino acid ABC transporter permease [Azospirillum sp.]|nr:branched-chain amino acid ABC transporter permease [Azospirillum sp.]
MQPTGETAARSWTAAVRLGVLESLGMPTVMLAASFLGFGSLVRGSGASLWAGLASTASTWALPGQIVQFELYGAGASLLAVGLAVWLTNARLLPMVVTLAPLIRDDRMPRWRYYAVAHLIALTGWVIAMKRGPELPRSERLPYFLGFTGSLFAVSLVATAIGFELAGTLPKPVTTGLMFLNPVYFMLMFMDVRHRSWVLALAVGAVLGPLLHRVDADWGLLVTGVLGGSLAFAGDRWWRRWRGGAAGRIRS